MEENHIHDCTGPDLTCPCGFKFSVPPISFSVEVYDRGKLLADEGFNTDRLSTVAAALRKIADKLEREG